LASLLVLGAGKLALGDMLFILLSFVLLTAAVKKFAWGPVTKMMDARSEKISGDLDYADQERARADKLAKEREDALKNSRAEAIEIVNKAKDNGLKGVVQTDNGGDISGRSGRRWRII